MNDLRTCGSCYNLVTAEEGTSVCPRCRKALEPTSEELLQRFVDHGTDIFKNGVKLQEAQKAAANVLARLNYTKEK